MPPVPRMRNGIGHDIFTNRKHSVFWPLRSSSDRSTSGRPFRALLTRRRCVVVGLPFLPTRPQATAICDVLMGVSDKIPASQISCQVESLMASLVVLISV